MYMRLNGVSMRVRTTRVKLALTQLVFIFSFFNDAHTYAILSFATVGVTDVRSI